MNVANHIKKTLFKVDKQITKMARYHPVIVGEWSLVLDGKSTRSLNPVQLEAARRAYGYAELMTFEKTSAWFYWTYKTENGGVWSFEDCVKRCRLPSFI